MRDGFIYVIYNKKDRDDYHFYVGSTVDTKSRWGKHKKDIRKKKTLLGEYISAVDGCIDDWCLSVLQRIDVNGCRDRKLICLESTWIHELKPHFNKGVPIRLYKKELSEYQQEYNVCERSYTEELRMLLKRRPASLHDEDFNIIRSKIPDFNSYVKKASASTPEKYMNVKELYQAKGKIFLENEEEIKWDRKKAQDAVVNVLLRERMLEMCGKWSVSYLQLDPEWRPFLEELSKMWYKKKEVFWRKKYTGAFEAEEREERRLELEKQKIEEKRLENEQKRLMRNQKARERRARIKEEKRMSMVLSE